MNLKRPMGAIAAALLLACGALHAQTTVEVGQAWVRATVPGQTGTGAFMNLTARDAARLVGVSSPAAGVAEVHEMKMDGDIMKMRALGVLELPAGQTVQLKPGGYHLMLMDLKQPLARGASVPLTLRFQDAKGVESQVQVTLPVASAAPAAAHAPAHDGAHKH